MLGTRRIAGYDYIGGSPRGWVGRLSLTAQWHGSSSAIRSNSDYQSGDSLYLLVFGRGPKEGIFEILQPSSTMLEINPHFHRKAFSIYTWIKPFEFENK